MTAMPRPEAASRSAGCGSVAVGYRDGAAGTVWRAGRGPSFHARSRRASAKSRFSMTTAVHAACAAVSSRAVIRGPDTPIRLGGGSPAVSTGISLLGPRPGYLTHQGPHTRGDRRSGRHRAPATAQLIERRWPGDDVLFPGRVQIPAALDRVEGDVVADRPAGQPFAGPHSGPRWANVPPGPRSPAAVPKLGDQGGGALDL